MYLRTTVTRFSLGELLVSLLQVVKRTTMYYPTNTLTNGVVDRQTMFFLGGSWVQIPPSTIIINFFRTFPMSNLKNTLPGIPTK